MQTHTTLAALRAQLRQWRREGASVGFVPTMGNLHAGHFALVELARRHADKVVASIFVNPTQFGPNEDYARYPRTPDADINGLAEHRCDALFLPPVEQMYPFGTMGCVQMHVPGITDILCGAHRPGHFNGVAQVVARLFNMVQPDLAVFGRKDYQQLQVIRYMTREMSFPVEIVPVTLMGLISNQIGVLCKLHCGVVDRRNLLLLLLQTLLVSSRGRRPRGPLTDAAVPASASPRSGG